MSGKRFYHSFVAAAAAYRYDDRRVAVRVAFLVVRPRRSPLVERGRASQLWPRGVRPRRDSIARGCCAKKLARPLRLGQFPDRCLLLHFLLRRYLPRSFFHMDLQGTHRARHRVYALVADESHGVDVAGPANCCADLGMRLYRLLEPPAATREQFSLVFSHHPSLADQTDTDVELSVPFCGRDHFTTLLVHPVPDPWYQHRCVVVG